jgi:hypothetical protein
MLVQAAKWTVNRAKNSPIGNQHFFTSPSASTPPDGFLSAEHARTNWSSRLKDMQTQMEKLRTDAAECELIADLATNTAKRDLFARLASHLRVLGDEAEKAMNMTGGSGLV